MIRIQAAYNPGSITIAIDGQLTAEYVAEVESSIRKSMEQSNDVHLFLRNVSHIDEMGHLMKWAMPYSLDWRLRGWI